MSKIATYQLTLEVDVEIEDEKEVSEETNFGTYVENGTISIYANHGGDWIVGSVQTSNTLLRIKEEE